MEPTLREGRVVIGLRWFHRLAPGDIVIIEHQGMEKIKRLTNIRKGEVFVAGDNPAESTDSRSFGWIDRSAVVAKVTQLW